MTSVSSKQHFKGSRHKKKLEEQNEKLEEQNERSTIVVIGAPRSLTANYCCEMCGLSSLSKQNYEQHLKGSKHRKVATSVDSLTPVFDGGVLKHYSCEICGIPVISKGSAEQHVQGKKHQKSLKTAINVIPAQEVKETRSYSCELCGLPSLGKTSYEQHMKGKKHKMKMKEGMKVSETKPTSEPIEDFVNLVLVEALDRRILDESEINKLRDTFNYNGQVYDIDIDTEKMNIVRTINAIENSKSFCDGCECWYSESPQDHVKNMKHISIIDEKAREVSNLEAEIAAANLKIEKECSICYELVGKRSKVFECDQCNIKLHWKCWVDWQNRQSQCPNCRQMY
eukprot:TRINITY_DN123_c0_g1_i2.p1 TRINITY_DN123_c0_g1~~TRINITY_DN123_c0_g1_i2.p1  ORF type:complete len:340 (-),score=78.88 TRINITY_DN123_c0_g1_i2:276-1295(-)